MNTLLLIILFVPLVEIYLFIQIGGQIGAFNTILIILLTAVVGIYFVRLQGLNTLKSGVTQLYKNKIPANVEDKELKRYITEELNYGV